MHSIEHIRDLFATAIETGDFVIDKTGSRTIEIIGACFKADENHIFGDINQDYIERELAWYKSKSLFVEDIPGDTPAIWKQVADSFGSINSNYGFLIWSDTNGNQYQNVLKELRNNPNSRRAVMIYTRPSMHFDYNKNGMSDFICTNAVNYTIRKGRLHAVVQMRSNDAIFGMRNDYAWQKYVQEQLASDLGVEVGIISWQVSSLHVYERHFYLVHHYHETGYTSISKKDYIEKYPFSPYAKK